MDSELKALNREATRQVGDRTGGPYMEDDPDLKVLPAGAKDVFLDVHTSLDDKLDLGPIKKR
ncbi:hypothetical protein TWF106_009126 [Orbilia oligospora]|uniref:Uncharacterized protein n=1 Tax=Orbilia oligospora TaxID=2813651 RepID=A0A6G1MBS8_ORBOL|nr:hypothetical protein TWF191_001060 [Orbilia oligospora]KAF3216403.1 hypothetical protein TWF679_003023 [Orbilia oligospora]KAF3227612.1 hypothetical protein TWF106_009126 [Orbilia oligospora]KAF3251108.1 hypothetical protein TWF192_005081 [Orbilia oligospora]